MDSYLGAQVESLSNANLNVNNGTGTGTVGNTSSGILGGKGGLEGDSGSNLTEQLGDEMKREDGGGESIPGEMREAEKVLPLIATTEANSISPSLSISTFYSMSNSKASSFSLLPDTCDEKAIKEAEEFTTMTEFKVYTNGQYVRDLTEKEKENDFVVSECRKNIEEERERILLERSMVMSGAPLSATTSLDKKKKLKKKIEKTRSNTK